jgi:hypothetical protein
MPQGDWQFETAYEDKYALDAPGFAFEYLRRNRSFIRDHRRLESLLKRDMLSQKTRDAYARRWGMRFREIHSGGPTSDDPVDNDSSPGCRSIDAGVDRIRPLPDAPSPISASLDRRADR